MGGSKIPSSLPARFGSATARGVAAEAAAASVRRLRTRFVDGEAATADLVRVQLGDRPLRLFLRAHFDECEPACPPGGHVAHHFHRFARSRAREKLLEL